MNKIIGLGCILASGFACAADTTTGSSDIISTLLNNIDGKTITAAVLSIGAIVISTRWGEKGISIVKRISGKI